MELKDCQQLVEWQVGEAELMFGDQPVVRVAIGITYSINGTETTIPPIVMSAEAARSIAGQLLDSAASAEAARLSRPAH